MVFLVREVHLVHQVLKVQRETLEEEAKLDKMVKMVHLVSQVPPVFQDLRVLLQPREIEETQAPEENQDHKDVLETEVLLDLLDFKDCQVFLEQLDH